MKISFRTLAFAAFALVASVCVSNAQNLQPGRVKAFFVRGDVTLRNIQSGAESKLSRGQEFTEGYVVTTALNSTALLVFSNGSSMNLLPNTSLNVTQYLQEPYNLRQGSFAALEADPSQSKTLLDVEFGEIVGEVKKLRKDSEFTVNTPGGAAGIRGTKFVVAYDPATGKTSISTLSGTVVAIKDGQEVAVPPGTAVEVDVNTAGIPAPAAISEALVAQIVQAAQVVVAAAEVAAQVEQAAIAAGKDAETAAQLGDLAGDVVLANPDADPQAIASQVVAQVEQAAAQGLSAEEAIAAVTESVTEAGLATEPVITGNIIPTPEGTTGGETTETPVDTPPPPTDNSNQTNPSNGAR